MLELFVYLNMKIVVAGGSGLVGSHLIPILMQKGHEVVVLTTQTKPSQQPYQQEYWDPSRAILSSEILMDTDVVINLAGYSIANRWTPENKQKMVDSRVQSTQTLVRGFLAIQKTIKLWIGASASGYYVPGDSPRSEKDSPATDFLGKLTATWENCNFAIGSLAKRQLIMRIPVVLAKEDGAIRQMLPLYRLGLGAPVGSGHQKMTWIHVDDLARFIDFTIDNSSINGIYNIGSSEIVTNKTFSSKLAKVLRRPHFLPCVPGWALHLLYGEMATLVLQSRNLNTDKFQQSGFQLLYPTIDESLNHLLANS
jgi:uncharacterized protein